MGQNKCPFDRLEWACCRNLASALKKIIKSCLFSGQLSRKAADNLGIPCRVSRILTCELTLGRYVQSYATTISYGISEQRPSDTQLAKKHHSGSARSVSRLRKWVSDVIVWEIQVLYQRGFRRWAERSMFVARRTISSATVSGITMSLWLKHKCAGYSSAAAEHAGCEGTEGRDSRDNT